MIRQSDLSQANAINLIQACFLDLVTEAEEWVPHRTPNPAMELGWQSAMTRERVGELTSQIAAQQYEPDVVMGAKRLLQARDFDLDAVPEGVRADLLLGLTRAMTEQMRLHLVRLEDRLAPYTPKDPLFQSAPATSDGPPIEFLERAPGPAAAVGPTVEEAVRCYIASKKKSCTPKTHATRLRQLGYLLEHLGPDTRIVTVTTGQIASFRDAVERFRSNHHVGAGSNFTSRQTISLDGRIAPKTATLILETVKAFFRWAGPLYLAGSNPALPIHVEVPKGLKSKKARRAFTDDELVRLFSAPMFTGCKAPKRRLEPGTWVIKDARYWIPIVAYFTGLRLGEIVQLHLGDVRLDGPVPYIHVTDEGSGPVGSDTAKHLKTAAALRMVPLHPQIIALGFGDFVRNRTNARRHKRLFWEVPFGADGQASTVFSKVFARLMDKTELTDPMLVFHSFRHNMMDALRNSLVPPQLIAAIMGHDVSAEGEGGGYGDGVWLETAYPAIKGMRLKVDLDTGIPIKSCSPKVSL